MKYQKTEYHSYRHGELPKGCQYCVKGTKLVLFLTGICPRHCYFCPLSEHKYGKDVTFANERPVHSFQDLKDEAKLMRARGAGITGGDPLAKLERTVEYIQQMKKEFGRKFHLHLYTSLDLVTEESLTGLHQAGLDEIRFHLDLDNPRLWHRLDIAKRFSWDVGVEIPVLIDKEMQIKKMIDFIHGKVKFLNLNELELADTPICQLRKLGHEQKDELSYAVLGSEVVGLKLLEYISKNNYSLQAHLCTVKLKDAIQLTERIKREAQQAKQVFDKVDQEGLLIRGAVYLPELFPSFSYQEKLQKANKKTLVKRLGDYEHQLKKELKLRSDQLYLDKEKLRILLSQAHLKKHLQKIKKMGLVATIVKEYPTYDQLEVELEFI